MKSAFETFANNPPENVTVPADGKTLALVLLSEYAYAININTDFAQMLFTAVHYLPGLYPNQAFADLVSKGRVMRIPHSLPIEYLQKISHTNHCSKWLWLPVAADRLA